MNMQNDKLELQQEVWERYRNNLPRYLIGLSRHLQSQTMHTLTEKLNYGDLKLNYEPFFTLVGEEGCRLTELADWLGISKQSCNRTANQIKKGGYLVDRPDPSDGRAKILVMTDKGRTMVRQAYELGLELERSFQMELGTKSYAELQKLLRCFCDKLELPKVRVDVDGIDGSEVLLASLLPRLSEYVMHRLMDLTKAKGHFGLKMSHGQVLSLIGLSGGRIQQIAKIQEVSKQAISAIAKELDQLGYIRQSPDPQDARGVVLMFTDDGLNLLTDSVASLSDVDAELKSYLGETGLDKLEAHAKQLYQYLHLEEEIFKPNIVGLSMGAGKNLHFLADSLKQQLGEEGARVLAHLLISSSSQ